MAYCLVAGNIFGKVSSAASRGLDADFTQSIALLVMFVAAAIALLAMRWIFLKRDRELAQLGKQRELLNEMEE